MGRQKHPRKPYQKVTQEELVATGILTEPSSRHTQKAPLDNPCRYSGYKLMWVMVIFDLPVTSKPLRHAYQQFRQRLLDDGFWQLQFSVYVRPCQTEENATVHRHRVEDSVPKKGEVRIMMFTDKQWERQECFFGRKKVPPEKQPDQLTFF